MSDCFTYLMHKSEPLPASVFRVAYKPRLAFRTRGAATCIYDVSSLSPARRRLIAHFEQRRRVKLLLRAYLGLRVYPFPSNIVWLKKCDL